MKQLSKSEWFELPNPIAEPDVLWDADKYTIERVTNNETIIWFGVRVNWRRMPNQGWTKLMLKEGVVPSETGIYPENSTYFGACEEPIYETMYRELNKIPI